MSNLEKKLDSVLKDNSDERVQKNMLLQEMTQVKERVEMFESVFLYAFQWLSSQRGVNLFQALGGSGSANHGLARLYDIKNGPADETNDFSAANKAPFSPQPNRFQMENKAVPNRIQRVN